MAATPISPTTPTPQPGPQALVAAFHRSFGLALEASPTTEVAPHLPALRRRLMEEELAEVTAGMAAGDLVNLAHELADVTVVVYGTAHTFGIDLDAALATQLAPASRTGSVATPAELVAGLHAGRGVVVPPAPALASAPDARRCRRALGAALAITVAAMEAGDLERLGAELARFVTELYLTAAVFGIDLDAVVAEVMHSNMSKLDADGLPVMRADGKVLKGPCYVAPDVAGVLGLAAA